MEIYIDSKFKCHVKNDGSMTEVETDFFDGKCPEYIEGYRFVPQGAVWVREDGTEFKGEMITAWKPYKELDEAQREYERLLMEDMKNALHILGVSVDG